jgi:hypothetical protein
MKTQLALFFSLVTLAAWAQTNSVQVSTPTNFFPFLNCASNVVYTNATILSVTPLYADVEFDAGLERVPLQNLPDFLQQRYHYNPTNAAQFELAEKARAKARKLAQAAQAAEEERLDAANRGNLCTIQVEQILDDQFGYLKCAVSGRNGGGGDVTVPSRVLLNDLPDSVREILTQIEQQKAAIKNLQAQKIVATSTVNDPNDPDPGFTAQMNANNALYDAEQAKKEKLEAMKDDLETMQDNLAEKTQVRAYFTGNSYAGFQIWECVQN